MSPGAGREAGRGGALDLADVGRPSARTRCRIVAALAAVADGCAHRAGSALEWLVTVHRAYEMAPAAAPMIGGGGLKIEVNGF